MKALSVQYLLGLVLIALVVALTSCGKDAPVPPIDPNTQFELKSKYYTVKGTAKTVTVGEARYIAGLIVRNLEAP
jgi:hypothetical protein